MIKFKAWNIKNKKMWDVTRLDFGDDGKVSFIWCRGKKVGVLLEQTCGSPDGFDLLQFIGAKDRNGDEIYRGFKVEFIRPIWNHNGELKNKKVIENVIFEDECFHANNYVEDVFEVDWKDMTIVGHIYQD